MSIIYFENRLVKVACILDEFSYRCFQYECTLIPITPDDWKQVLLMEKPDLLLVESAWEGNNGAWTNKIITGTKELYLLVNWCKDNNIPAVFWNKEDPFSFDRFIDKAKWFDIIFTTDINCINRYKELVGSKHVYLLPFAAQIAIYNPIEIYDRRQDKASFLGTYYAAKFPERQNDFERIFSVIEPYGLDIYDRHFEKNIDEVKFPSKYQSYIRGTLSGEEIIKGYKEYKFSINLNSVKDSLTMFARRVIELMACNTIVISSYSKGMQEMFGDLTVCSDDQTELKEKIEKLITDDLYYNKYRLLGLREVLQYHTYQERFGQIIEKALNIKIPSKWQSVAIIGFADNIEEMKKIKEQFMRQIYKNKSLYIFCSFKCENIIEDDINQYYVKKIKDKQIKDIIMYSDYIGYFNKNDYYGENYLTDLMCVPLYLYCDAFGKATYFEANDHLLLCHKGKEYRFVDQLLYRNSLVRRKSLEEIQIEEYSDKIFNKEIIVNGILFSINCFNYIFNGSLKSNEEHLKIVSDLDDNKKGKEIVEIEKDYYNSNTVNMYNDELKLDLSKFIALPDNNLQIKTDKYILITSKLSQNEHLYVCYNCKPHNFDIIPKNTQLEVSYDYEYLMSSFGTSEQKIIVSIVAIAYSKNKKEKAYFLPINQTKILDFEAHIEKVNFCIRVQGEGEANIDEVIIKKRKRQAIEKSDAEYLVLTNIYPTNDNLYQNAFVHRRVKNYIEESLNVDVFVLSYYERNQITKYEFDGVKVYKGYKNELRELLKSGNYKKVLVHFINPDMYEVLKEYLQSIKVIVWLHGAEVQPWYRRSFNYVDTDETELLKAQKASNKRMEFIKYIMQNATKKIHFVFVSETFKNEVLHDIGYQLESYQYSIIHNVIDTDLFKYTKKTLEHRKKILIIRPFASRKYANDLTIKAILELSKKDLFNHLEFCIYGKGILFEEIVKPIQHFKNVKIYEKFLSQDEIAEIHKIYGIFLVPTRMDSQGVSRDEAMSSGLVPITNKIASIPEFVDENCCMLVDDEDYEGLAEAIEYLYNNPEEFLKKSENASTHVRKLSGKANTIEKEISLITNFEYSIQPKISIIIPAYNVEKYIGEAIKSLINQTIGVENLEIIIVNDASTDNTSQIIEGYAKKFNQIIAIHKIDRLRFPGKLRNMALLLATGEYIMFLDSDDIMVNDACEKMYEAINTINDSDMIYGKYSLLHDNTGNVEPADYFEQKKYQKPIININLRSLESTKTDSNIYELRLNLINFLDLKDKNLEINVKEDLNINSSLSEIQHQYIYYGIYHSFDQIPNNTQMDISTEFEYIISIKGEKVSDINISFVVISYSKYKKESVKFITLNNSSILKFGDNIEKVIFAIRVQGTGQAKIKEIVISKIKNTSDQLSLEDLIKHPGTSCSKIYRTEFLRKNKITFPETQYTGEDYIFNHKCLLSANKISYLPIEIFYYRRRNDIQNPSITQTFTTEIITDLFKQKIETSALYKNTPYPYDQLTNYYFLSVLYYKIMERKEEPYNELKRIFTVIQPYLNMFDLEDRTLSLHARKLMEYINYGKFDAAIEYITKR